MQPERVLIVGGGIGGLTSALALSRVGYRVALYEQAPEFGEIGAGIMLTPNATRVLIHLGLEAALDRTAMRPPASVYRRFDDARAIGDAPLAGAMETAYGAPYFHIHRSDLLDVLLAAVRAQGAADLNTGHRAASCAQNSEGVAVRFSDGQEVEGDLLLACDGVRSALRAQLVAGAEPRFRGQVAWRSLAPAAGLPARVTASESVVWIGHDRHIVQYVLRGGAWVNYVAVAVQERWTEEGWNLPAEPGEVRAEFAGWHEDVQALLAATPAGGLHKWGLFDREPLEQLVYGRIVLLGDAAHPMLPFMAQGSAMAIEDAMILTRCLKAHSSRSAALDRYQALRAARTARVIAQSRAQTSLYQRLAGDKQQQRRQGVDWVYGFNAVRCAL